jgi:hypothetical protein
MQVAFNQFKKNIQDIKDLHVRYLHFATSLRADDLSDILRSEYVYAVSALDRLVHELVRIGMLEIFNNTRTATPQYNNFRVSMDILQNIQKSSQQIQEDTEQIDVYIKELETLEEDDQEQRQAIEDFIEGLRNQQIKQPYQWFEEEIIRQHGFISYQKDDNISSGLSLISDVEHKWQSMATLMNIPSGNRDKRGRATIKDQAVIKTEFKNIITRRNAIVHEADVNPLAQQKEGIYPNDTEEIVNFIEKLGTAIFDLVKKNEPV